MEKFMFNKDKNADWTSTHDEPFPLSTASHSFHQNWNIIEGEKVINYRIIDCPFCKKSQKVNNKLMLGNDVVQIRCPWCNEIITYSTLPVPGLNIQYYIEEIVD